MLIGLFTVTLPIKFFLPLSWLLDVGSANIANRPYDGDVVVMHMDVQEDLPQDGIPTALPRVLERLAENPPKRIIIDHTPLSAMTAEGGEMLARSMERLPQKPFMAVPIYSDREVQFEDIYDFGRNPVRYRAGVPNALLQPHIVMINARLEAAAFGAPIFIPHTVDTDAGVLPSIAEVLAGASSIEEDDLPIDQRIDSSTVPILSADQFLRGEYSQRDLGSETIILAAHGVAARDLIFTARLQRIDRAVMLAVATQTLRDGRPLNLGPWPAFLLAAFAVIGWFFLQRPFGHALGLGVLVALLISPFLLHFALIFHDPSQGIALIVTFGASRLWRRYSDALEQAKDAAESRSWFLAQASHDLRQPIHAIGMLSSRLYGTELSPMQRDLVRKIERSVDGAGRMFKSLLDIAALENGSLKAVIAPVSVNEILAEVDEIQSLAAERAGVELRFVPSEAIVLTDRALAVTIVQNLVSNAIKYATGRKIVVGARRRGSRISLAVYDRGAGISREDLKQVSAKFVRADVAKRIEGTGLGLAIVERICDVLGLRFRIRSRQGHGTSALIEGFEVADELRKENVIESHARSPLLEDIKVVIVDDDHETLIATEAVVQQWGCRTEIRADLPAFPDCDLVLTDFDLGPAGTIADRIDTLTALRQRGIETIVLSGHATSLVRDKLGDAAFTILAKPLRPVELRSALLSAMTDSS